MLSAPDARAAGQIRMATSAEVRRQRAQMRRFKKFRRAWDVVAVGVGVVSGVILLVVGFWPGDW